MFLHKSYFLWLCVWDHWSLLDLCLWHAALLSAMCTSFHVPKQYSVNPSKCIESSEGRRYDWNITAWGSVPPVLPFHTEEHCLKIRTFSLAINFLNNQVSQKNTAWGYVPPVTSENTAWESIPPVLLFHTLLKDPYLQYYFFMSHVNPAWGSVPPQPPLIYTRIKPTLQCCS